MNYTINHDGYGGIVIEDVEAIPPNHYTRAATIYIHKKPTKNCQLSSIGYMNRLLSFTQKTPHNRVPILIQCFKKVAEEPKLILVDVRENYTEEIEKSFIVISKTPYISTNKSKMCLFIIKLSPEKF